MTRSARAVWLLLIALVALSGCATTTETSAQASAGPTLGRILERGTLVVGTAASMPPLNMTAKDGEIFGFEPELAKRMASAMGVELQLEKIPFAGLLPALQAGKVDMVMSGMSITPARNLTVAFVGPYLTSGKCFLTKNDTIAQSTQDLKRIDGPQTILAALKGSTSEAFIKKVLPNTQLRAVDEYDEAIELVLSGEIHALLADYPICAVTLYRNPNQGLASVLTLLTYEPLGIAVPPDDPLLVNWLQNYLHSMRESGNIGEMKTRWFENISWVQRLQ